MSGDVEIVTFDCAGERLLGLLHRGALEATRAVLLVVGGPQYRAGSHRQFVLVARALSSAGIPVLRFDYRGMGDSGGEYRGFEQIGDDIRAAADALQAHCPRLREIVIWGLCDAASAAMFYARFDERIKGMVLLNPWVRTEAGQAKSYLRYYYSRRLFDRQFWRSLLGGKVNPWRSAASLLSMLRKVLSKKPAQQQQMAAEAELPQRMYNGISGYTGRVLFILCGDDLTAGEFKDVVAASNDWQQFMQRQTVTRRDLAAANHTFSREEWRAQIIHWTCDWIRSW